MTRSYAFSITVIFLFVLVWLLGNSCANIVPPTGGPRDSLPPVLIKATPNDSAKHFTAGKITLEFDEFVTVDNAQQNVIIWPNPKTQPVIESKLRTITIRLKDSLEKNITYTINFGKSLKDVNEGNADSSFSYVFTTGNRLDNNVLKGNVKLAETGKTDTTLIVVLHTNLSDTAIQKTPPRYYTKLDGKGNFRFFNLPSDTFAVFVVPNDFTKRYDDSTKLFAFLKQPVLVNDTGTAPVTLYAYQEYTGKEIKPGSASRETGVTANGKSSARRKTGADTTLKVAANLNNGKQDFQKNLELTFSDTLQRFDSAKFHLTDTNYVALAGVKLELDTAGDKLILTYRWQENTPYKLVIEKDAVADSSGFTLAKNDSLSFTTLRESDYGSMLMQFQNLDTARHPVLELVQNEKIVQYVPLTSYRWYQKFILPGDYELRVLYDTNGNGVWDAGNYNTKQEPEVVEEISPKGNKKISVRANWDNEFNITL